MNKIMKFELGDKTDQVWCGDIVTECEFLCYTRTDKLLFYDTKFKCFRLAHWEPYYGKMSLNGWKCANTISELLNK